jgi:hypothetical protein
MDKELDFITDLLGEFLGKEDPRNVALVLSRLDSTLPVVLGKLPGAIQAEGPPSVSASRGAIWHIPLDGTGSRWH